MSLAAVLLCAAGCGSATDALESSQSGSDVEPTAQISEALTCGSTSVPQMTSATAPSGVVTRSGVFDSSYEAWRAFDASDSSMWISAVFQTPAWIGYQFPSAKRVINYAIKFVNGSLTTRAPKNWTLQGYNGWTWVVIDTRSNEKDWAGVEERTYNVASPGLYSRYRLNVTDDNDDRAGVVVVSMGKLSFMTDDCSIDWNQLNQHWHRDSSQSTSTVDYYVPFATRVPPGHFVPAMLFRSNGEFEKLMLASNDAHYFASGSWTRNGSRLNTVVNDPTFGVVNTTYNVLSLTPTVLRVVR